MPHIDQAVFAARRQRLTNDIGPDAVALIGSGSETLRNYDVNYPFRPDSNFHYLTGFPEPEAVAVIASHQDGVEYTLFVSPKDRETEIWTGLRAGTEGARSEFGADQAYDIAELPHILAKQLIGKKTVWYPFGSTLEKTISPALAKVANYRSRLGNPGPELLQNLTDLLASYRLVKAPEEIAVLRSVGELSARGHLAAMQYAEAGRNEGQVAGHMEAVWREGGSVRDGYPSIVAGGANAVILHYTQNSDTLHAGDLLLIDAAAELEMYSADITRTFPVDGTFTSAQRALYEVVYEAQSQATEMVAPGSTFRQLTDHAIKILTEGLVSLGLLPTGVEEAIAMHHYAEFFMHGLGHWLGLDVHDAGNYRHPDGWIEFEPGMVFTVEPGLYINPDRPEVEFSMLEYDRDQWMSRRLLDPKAKQAEAEERKNAATVTHTLPPEFLGLGIRIEDDVAVTTTGVEVLTSGVPSRLDLVEAACR